GRSGQGIGSGAGAVNVHEHILSLVRPYPHSQLYKDLTPDNRSSEEASRATNPSAVKAVLDGSAVAYKISSPNSSRLRVIPKPMTHDKKSLFDGLEENDPSMEVKLSLRPSRKRLVIRPRRDDASSVEHEENNRSTERSAAEESALSEGVTSPGDSAPESLRRGSDQHDGFVSIREKKEELLRTFEQLNDRTANTWPASRLSPSEKQTQSEERWETTPLYPILDKEVSTYTNSERRASWLKSKMFRKPLASNPDMAENSVQELGLKERSVNSSDKENMCTFYVSEEESLSMQEAPPHPAGVKLSRPGYYTIPSLEEMTKYLKADGSCVVPHLTIGRKNYGSVYFDCDIDVANMDLDNMVHFLNKEVIIYPEDSEKPPLGEGLNRRAIVTLDRVWPRDKTEKRPITEPHRLLQMDYEGKLRRVCDKYDTKFIEYRPETGSWVFRVEHFSKYGLADSDEEDEITPEVLKRQLVTNNLQQNAAAQKASVSSPGLVGHGLSGPGLAGPILAGLSGLGGLGEEIVLCSRAFSEDRRTGFDMDTAEYHGDGASLYDSRALGVKSPTSELARLERRETHNLQLMKASLYTDVDVDMDNVSVSTEDQLVPRTPSVISAPASVLTRSELIVDLPTVVEEPVMRPLVVQPQTVVLKYHKKIPPFKETIAGRMQAAFLADMSVCRARHSRLGFAVGNTIAFTTTVDSLS
ncbi:unnamed protein product, partial [Leptidea sinapis]